MSKTISQSVVAMLQKSAEADKEKALLTLKLLMESGVGIGDHSTDDFYNNAEDALSKLSDADDRLETIEKYFGESKKTLLNG